MKKIITFLGNTFLTFGLLMLPGQTLAATVLFSDGFESGFTNWTTHTGNWVFSTGDRHSGSNKALVIDNTNPDDDILQKSISTTGYESITLSYWYKVANSLESDDHLVVEWSGNGGVTWTELADYSGMTTMSSWTQAIYDLPVGASDNTQFSFRFRAKFNSGSDAFRLDDVSLTGTLSDATPPTITPNVTGTLGDNGWYISDVSVSWTVVDDQSAVTSQSGCDSTNIVSDTSGTTLTCTAASAGGTASQSVTIKRDATAPVVAVTPDRSADHNNWYNHPVTVVFNGVDAVSDSVTCDSPVVYSGPDSISVSVSGQCTDAAGNSGSAMFNFQYDATAPAIPVHLTPADNSYFTTATLDKIDWEDSSDLDNTSLPVTYLYQSSHSTDVNVTGSFISPAYTSGMLSQSEIPTPGTPEGVYYWHVKAIDNAGNESAWSDPWKIIVDNTAPVITAGTPIGTQGDSGWYKSDVTVPFSATDNLAGFALDGSLTAALESKTTTGEGDSLFLTSGTISDLSGNAANAITVGPFKVDKTAPNISSENDGKQYLVGQEVTVNFDCSDDLSGEASCVTDPLYVSGESVLPTDEAGVFHFTVTATDNAGNISSKIITYQVYGFLGLFKPVTTDIRSFQKNSTIPVKFALDDGQGGRYGEPSAQLYIQKQGEEAWIPAQSSGSANTSNNFRYDASAGQYIFNLSTKMVSDDGFKFAPGSTYNFRIVITGAINDEVETGVIQIK